MADSHICYTQGLCFNQDDFMQREIGEGGRIRIRWIMWTLAALSYDWGEWKAQNLLWVFALHGGLIFISTHVLLGLAVRYLRFLNGPNVAVTIPRAERLFRGPAFISACVATLLVGNLWFCQLTVPSRVEEVAVYRGLCKKKVGFAEVHNGKACFTRWHEHGYPWRGRVSRFDVGLLQGDIRINSKATLVREVINPDSPWNWGQYARVISVR